jgi:predicted RecB family nuclease
MSCRAATLLPQNYRFAEYAAYYRYVKARLESACDGAGNSEGEAPTYPEPCAHCNVCRWWQECKKQWREDDHLSLVASITRLQRDQLERWDKDTVARLAAMELPLRERPLHGSREGYVRVREQARVQVDGRTRNQLVHEMLEVAEGMGLCELAEPSPGDLFVDLEGDQFVDEGGRQYLFGMLQMPEKNSAGGNGGAAGAIGSSTGSYQCRWNLTAAEEKANFEWLVDEIMRRWQDSPGMHVYHFGAYEPGKFKYLMGRYATREEEIDRMLRAGLLVDLHTVLKRALRASVEEYSLKALELFHSFARKVDLEEARAARRQVEHWLELEWGGELPLHAREIIEGYNEDDCRSTQSLREWLEVERTKLIERGKNIPRPAAKDGAPSEGLDERQRRVAAIVEALTADLPADDDMWTRDEGARWILAQLMDWHRREDKASFWEGFRLEALDDEELLDERAGLSGLRFLERVRIEKRSAVERYAFEKQDTEVRAGKDVYHRVARENEEEGKWKKPGEHVGKVCAIDLGSRTVDIKKTQAFAGKHPGCVYAWDKPIDSKVHAEAVMRIGEWVRENGIDDRGSYRAARDLLLRRPPRLTRAMPIASRPGESALDCANRLVQVLDDSVLAIQGPPGAGKTFTGARMILELVKTGKKIGVSAFSHNAIRNLLDMVVDAAREQRFTGLRCMQKPKDSDDSDGADDAIAIARTNAEVFAGLQSGEVNVVGGTSWLWCRTEAFESVDFLFIDEAGQMALADVISASHAARNLVLIGDPQQLERPTKGSHPPGAERSALEHVLGDRKTIPDDMGLLLPETFRMHRSICEFTSEIFYDGRLARTTT